MYIHIHIYIYTHLTLIVRPNLELDVDSEMTILIPPESLYFPSLFQQNARKPATKCLATDEFHHFFVPARNPEAVQEHLCKCFDAISFVTFTQASSSDVRLMIDWSFHLWEGDGAEAAKLATAGQLFRWHRWDTFGYPGLVAAFVEPGKEEGHHRHE